MKPLDGTKIPTELVGEIATFSPATHPNFGGINSWCLVSKSLNAIATPLLYRHIVIRLSNRGFTERAVRSLLSKRHKNHKYIREISIKREHFYEGVSYWQRYPPHPGLKAAAVHLAAFIESLDEGQLQCINSEDLEVLKYLSPSCRSKVKSVQWNYSRDLYGEIAFFPSIKSLTFRELGPYIYDFGRYWAKTERYRKQLKSLSLEGYHYDERPPVRETLPDGPGFDALEHLSIRLFVELISERLLEPMEAWKLIPFQRLKSLELISCCAPGAFLLRHLVDLANLTHLVVDHRNYIYSDIVYNEEDAEQVLLNLPSRLQSLQWTAFANRNSRYPTKQAIQRHSATLKKLWLEISYKGSDDVMEDRPHYQYENQFRMLEVPIRSDEVLDLEALSQFPALEHLAVPVAAPESWSSWAPLFPELRSFYLVNSCKLYCEGSLPTKCFRQDWIYWFTSAYHQHQNQSNPLNLQLIAFQRPLGNLRGQTDEDMSEDEMRDNRIPEPGSRGFTAHFQEPDRPGYFSKKAYTSEFVRYAYPEAWEFIKGYFATENREYMWPNEDTNVAKGVFEDEDEVAPADVRAPKSSNRRKNREAERAAEEECPIDRPHSPYVRLPEWPAYDNTSTSSRSEQPLAEGMTFQDYQNQFLLFEEQAKKREEYITARIQQLTVGEKTV
ncbi:hypothetical protein TWF281_001295 [Arthrobotrys megalospora]